MMRGLPLQFPQDAPLFTSWGQVALFAVAVSAAVGWLWKVLRADRAPPPVATDRLVDRIFQSSDRLREELTTTRQYLHQVIEQAKTRLEEEVGVTRHDLRNEMQKLYTQIMEEFDKQLAHLEVAVKEQTDILLRDAASHRRRGA
jgi:hypothetical protein